MKTNFKFTDTPVDDQLRDYAQQKVDAFGKFIHGGHLDGAVCDVEFKGSTHHQSGDICYAEVNLDAGGNLYRATKTEPTFNKAIDKVKDDILSQLRREKEQRETAIRRGGVQAKEML